MIGWRNYFCLDNACVGARVNGLDVILCQTSLSFSHTNNLSVVWVLNVSDIAKPAKTIRMFTVDLYVIIFQTWNDTRTDDIVPVCGLYLGWLNFNIKVFINEYQYAISFNHHHTPSFGFAIFPLLVSCINKSDAVVKDDDVDESKPAVYDGIMICHHNWCHWPLNYVPWQYTYRYGIWVDVFLRTIHGGSSRTSKRHPCVWNSIAKMLWPLQSIYPTIWKGLVGQISESTKHNNVWRGRRGSYTYRSVR